MASYITIVSQLELDVGKNVLSRPAHVTGSHTDVYFVSHEAVVTVTLPQHVVHLPPPGNSGTFCSVHTKSSSTSVQRTSCLSFRKVFTSLLCGGACYLKEGCLFLSRLLLQYKPVWLGACLSDWNSGFSSVALNSPHTIWLHMRVYIHWKARPDVCVVAVEVALLSEYHSVTACSNHGTLGALITTHMSIELPRSHHFLLFYLLYRSVWYQ